MIYFKIKGDLVFVDRWPGTNRHLRKNNIWKSVNTIMYAFFPDPDLYIFLFAPPEIISLRKTDLNTEEIKCLQKNIEKKITSKKHYKVKTVDIDLSLKKILIIISKLIGTKIFN
jgi:thymidylate kinase